MPTYHLPEGVGGATGAALATASDLYTNAQIIYVDATTGSDTYTGHDRRFPKATVKSAIDAATTIGSIVVCLQGHAETITTAIPMDTAGVSLVAEGSSSGEPTVVLTLGGTTNNVITVTASNCLIANLKFKPHTTGSTGVYIAADGSSDGGMVDGCVFEQDEFSNAPAVTLAASCDSYTIKNCTFRVSETTVGSPPDAAVQTGGALSNLVLDSCTFDGGTVGWDTAGDGTGNNYAFDGSAASINPIKVSSLTLKGSVFKVASGSTGHIQVSTVTGGGRVEW